MYEMQLYAHTLCIQTFVYELYYYGLREVGAGWKIKMEYHIVNAIN